MHLAMVNKDSYRGLMNFITWQKNFPWLLLRQCLHTFFILCASSGPSKPVPWELKVLDEQSVIVQFVDKVEWR